MINLNGYSVLGIHREWEIPIIMINMSLDKACVLDKRCEIVVLLLGL